MKTKTVLLVALVFWQNYLFYDQDCGLNFLAFAITLLAVAGYYSSQSLRQKNVRMASAGFIISALTLGVYGEGPSILLYFGSLFLLAGYWSAPALSPYVAAFNGGLSSSGVASAHFVSSLLNSGERLKSRKKWQRDLKNLIVPVGITVVFYFLYNTANPDFSLFTTNYTINSGYVVLTLLGFLYIPAFVFPYSLNVMHEYDLKIPNSLKRIRSKFKGNILGLKWEYKQAIILFLLLNILIGIFLFIELKMLFTASQNQHASELSSQVHDNVSILIFSILCSILVILYYFRKNLNFYPVQNTLIRLSYAWIIQNMVLLLVTLSTNNTYVFNYGLTYHRIGVYIWLFITAIGLISTLYKIAFKKSNAYLFRFNSWSLYFILILSFTIPWSTLITHYNLHYSQSKDLIYLLSLEPYVIPELNAIQTDDPYFRKDLNVKIASFKKQYNRKPNNWRSWNYSDWQLNEYLKTHPFE